MLIEWMKCSRALPICNPAGGQGQSVFMVRKFVSLLHAKMRVLEKESPILI